MLQPGRMTAALMLSLFPIVLSAMLLSVRGTLLFIGGYLLGMFLMPELFPAVHFGQVYEPMAFIFGLSALVVMYAAVRQYDMIAIERKNDQLTNSEARFRSLFDGVSEGILVHEGGVILDVNQGFERLFGYAVEDAVSMSLFDFVAPESRVSLQNALSSDAGERHYELVAARRDGSRFTVEVVSQGVRAGHQLSVLEFRDISANKALRDEIQVSHRGAEAAARFQTMFINATARQMHSEMQALVKLVEPIVDGTAPGGDAARAAVEVHAKGQSLQRLINEIGVLSQLQGHASQLRKQSIDLDRLIHEVVEPMRAAAEQKGIEIRTEPFEGSAALLSDQPRLAYVVKHLVANAVLASERGMVHVRAKATPDGRPLRIDIIDSGPAIPSATLSKVFDAFAPTGRKKAGAGLGLTICRAVCDLLGFRLTVESYDHLTTFRIVFESAQSSGDTLRISASGGQAARALVLHDDAGVRRDLCDLAREPGWHVTAPDAQRVAEGATIAQCPDVVLVDLGDESDRAGWQTVQCFKQDEQFRDVPVVLTRIRPGQANFSVLGGIDQLAAPVDESELVGCLSRNMAGADSLSVLVLEDDDRGLEAIYSILKRYGVEVRTVRDGHSAFKILAEADPDVFIVNPLLPDRGTLSFLEAIRADRRYVYRPLVLLHGPDRADKVAGVLDLLADGVARDATEARELLAYVLDQVWARELVRRSAANQAFAA